MRETEQGTVGAAGGNGGTRLAHARTIELRGYIIDYHILSQVMDVVMDYGAEF